MALSWSYKRRLEYLLGTFLIIAIIFGWIFFEYFYKSPTCNDGKKNGDETGIDCGGSCQMLCKNEAVEPVVLWSKIFNISGDVYNAAAYVDNPNINSRNPRAQYEFRIYDSNHGLLDTRTGYISIPKNKKIVVFEPGFVFKTTKPKYTEFNFISFDVWQKDDSLDPEINIQYSSLNSTSTSPRIDGTILNNSAKDISEMELIGLVLDGRENVVAVSRTFIEDLYKKTSQSFVFTWPKPFDLGVEMCMNPLDIVLVLDKSGSMRSEGENPPEPWSSVKATAENFIANLSNEDRVSIVSFGNSSTLVSPIVSNINSVIKNVEEMSLGTSSEQTNITDGLIEANNQIVSSDREYSKKVIILLTDGVPTLPLDKKQIDYPKISAKIEADKILSSGIDIYSIGLGKNVDEGFLKNISGTDSRYFFSPNKEYLSSIYKKISSALCQRKPNVINVIYRIP